MRKRGCDGDDLTSLITLYLSFTPFYSPVSFTRLHTTHTPPIVVSSNPHSYRPSETWPRADVRPGPDGGWGGGCIEAGDSDGPFVAAERAVHARLSGHGSAGNARQNGVEGGEKVERGWRGLVSGVLEWRVEALVKALVKALVGSERGRGRVSGVWIFQVRCAHLLGD